MSKASKRLLICILAFAILAGIGVYAATNYGSETDPLITKSYLDKVVRPEIETELQNQIDSAKANIYSTASGEFTELSLSAGQKIRCGAGSQLLLCSGSATSISSITDTTSGGNVNAGNTISINHLYLVPESDGGFAIGNNGGKVLVSGSYSIS